MSYISVDEIFENIDLISRNSNNDLSYKNCFMITYKPSEYDVIIDEELVNKRLNFKSINGDVSILFDQFGEVKNIEIDGSKEFGIKRIPQIEREDLMAYMNKHYEMDKGDTYRSTYRCFPENLFCLIFTESKEEDKIVDEMPNEKVYYFSSPHYDVVVGIDKKGYINSIEF
ncbi:hypothetical protein WG909_01155 [Peptostreptococcaceae bacterium AGR-M142]